MNKIKIAGLILIIAAIAFTGCSKKHLDEKEFTVIWQEYLEREFEESFDEKQSVSQREKILSGILSGYNISLNEMKQYMKRYHEDKYNKIFVK